MNKKNYYYTIEEAIPEHGKIVVAWGNAGRALCTYDKNDNTYCNLYTGVDWVGVYGWLEPSTENN